MCLFGVSEKLTVILQSGELEKLCEKVKEGGFIL